MESTKKSNPAPLKTHHETFISPATATTSGRREKKHVLRVSPYSPDSIDPELVGIDHVQLSQSVETTNFTHAQTDRLVK